MYLEILFIVVAVVGLYFILKLLKSKYKLQKFKPLILIPIVVIPFFKKGVFNYGSIFLIVISGIVLGYIVWKIIQNFRTNTD